VLTRVLSHLPVCAVGNNGDLHVSR
jgi:hypothetical protein